MLKALVFGGLIAVSAALPISIGSAQAQDMEHRMMRRHIEHRMMRHEMRREHRHAMRHEMRREMRHHRMHRRHMHGY